MNLKNRNELLINVIQYVSQEFRLPSVVKNENGDLLVEVGNCKEPNDCFGVFNVYQLVDKYSMITDDSIWIQRMYEMFTRMIRDNIEDKKDPDYMKTILTTFSKHDKYFVEKLPRSQYRHDSAPENPHFLTITFDGVQCVWSIGCESNSNYINGSFVDKIIPNRKDALNHLLKRWERDLEYHPQEVRSFQANVIIHEQFSVSNITLTFIHGPRIFELMTFAPSCKAVLDFLNIKIEKLTIFGLTQDLCFLENTDKKEELITSWWDRELLGQAVIDPSNYKRFDIFKEHQGTSFNLSTIKPLNLQLKKYNDNYFIPNR